MRIFKNAWFERFARKERLNDQALREAITRAEKGLLDADLGSGVIKQRIARQGQGKSGGYRSLIIFRSGDKAFFVYGFAKSDRDNLREDELETFKKAAKEMLQLSDEQIAELINKGYLLSRMNKKYRSEAFAAIHETMEALHEVGAIGKQTMREFDEACLSPIETLTPEQIREIREREQVSQPVFARYLNVSKNLVSDWERGKKQPGGSALKLLMIVRKKGLHAIS